MPAGFQDNVGRVPDDADQTAGASSVTHKRTHHTQPFIPNLFLCEAQCLLKLM